MRILELASHLLLLLISHLFNLKIDLTGIWYSGTGTSSVWLGYCPTGAWNASCKRSVCTAVRDFMAEFLAWLFMHSWQLHNVLSFVWITDSVDKVKNLKIGLLWVILKQISLLFIAEPKHCKYFGLYQISIRFFSWILFFCCFCFHFCSLCFAPWEYKSFLMSNTLRTLDLLCGWARCPPLLFCHRPCPFPSPRKVSTEQVSSPETSGGLCICWLLS